MFDCVSPQYKAAYVSQQAWIQNATVRDNILFGSRYNKKRYARVVAACELTRDFEILDAGDQTEIGEKVSNASILILIYNGGLYFFSVSFLIMCFYRQNSVLPG